MAWLMKCVQALKGEMRALHNQYGDRYGRKA